LLLTVFRAKERIKHDSFGINHETRLYKKISENRYLIHLPLEHGKEVVKGVMMQNIESAILAWQTYNLNESLKLTMELQRRLEIPPIFELYRFDHDLFVNWFDTSSQVLECIFDSSVGERSLVSFNLKTSEQFKKLLQDIKIKYMVFTLKEEKIIITGREEGRLSITPDLDDNKLFSVLDKLLGNNIVVAST